MTAIEIIEETINNRCTTQFGVENKLILLSPKLFYKFILEVEKITGKSILLDGNLVHYWKGYEIKKAI